MEKVKYVISVEFTGTPDCAEKTKLLGVVRNKLQGIINEYPDVNLKLTREYSDAEIINELKKDLY